VACVLRHYVLRHYVLEASVPGQVVAVLHAPVGGGGGERCLVLDGARGQGVLSEQRAHVSVEVRAGRHRLEWCAE